jgi:DNA polymerase-3 subunit gamma/tau
MRNLLVLLIAPQAAVLDLSEQDREDARRQAQRAGKMKLQTILDLLITREQDLRFASHPRLVLEAILLRACTIGDVLSFETLLERIATLEKDLINAGAPTEPDPSLHASDPVGPWTQGATEDPPARAKDWGAFLDVLSSKNKSMFNVLKEWEFVRFTEDQVELRRGRPLFSAAYFDDPERLRQLTTECRAFFQKDFKIRVLENSGSGSPQRMGSPLPDRGDPRKKYADLPPPVRDILQVFQGEIKGAPANSEKAAKTDGIRDLKKEGET